MEATMKAGGTEITATLLEGALAQIFALPKVAAPEVNDWSDEDGLEVDEYTPVVIEPQTLRIPMWMDRQRYGAILGHRVWTLSVHSWGSIVLRPTAIEELEQTPSGWTFILEAERVEDKPASDGRAWNTDLLIGYESLTTAVRLRNKLKETPSLTDAERGKVYLTPPSVRYASRECEIVTLLRASSTAELWAKRQRLLGRLTGKRLHLIPQFDEVLTNISAYYSSCACKEVTPESIELRLTFTITN